MSSERAVIYVESGTSLGLRGGSSKEKGLGIPKGLKSSSNGGSGGGGGGGSGPPSSNYVIKIQIGEEKLFNPMRIDVSSGVQTRALALSPDTDRNSGEESPIESSPSSPRSDMTPPPQRMSINTGGGNRFGSETSESDTESDISSEFRPLSCQAAQFAMREICKVDMDTPSPPLPRSIMKKPVSNRNKGGQGGQGGPPPLPTTAIPDSSKSLISLVGLPTPSTITMKMKMNGDNNEGDAILGSIMTLSESMAMKRAARDEAQGIRGHQQKIIMDQSEFHMNEIIGFNTNSSNGISNNKAITNDSEESLSNFAGYRDIFSRSKNDGTKQILSDRGTIRGVKNRVRDGIATFLQSKDTKTYSDKEQGRVVVYVTSMGVVRATFQRCQKVKQILRNLLVKFDERDCYMNRAIQNEIRQRLPQQILALPQVFLEGQLLGDAEIIEKLNETGELRDLLKPYKSLSVLSTCERCGGFRMLPCPICNGSKKSVHRNHFTTEFIALKCMHCDPSGLIRCDLCNAPDP